MHQAHNAHDYAESVRRALDWLVGMQSANGGFAAFDADNTYYSLNKIPFADHGALLDPPDQRRDGAGGDGTVAGGPPAGQAGAGARHRVSACGTGERRSWFGRWGTNYIYGTWSVLTAFAQAGLGRAGSRGAARRSNG